MTDTPSPASDAPARTPENFNVEFEVLLPGDGLIFTGEYDASRNRFATLKRGKTGSAHSSIVQRLAERGLVKIVEKK